MKRLILASVLAFLLCVSVQAADKVGDIEVTLTDLRNDNGGVSVVLFSSKEGFPKKAEKAVKVVRGAVKDKKAKLVFSKIPYGEYAFVVLHDENGNKKMDYNALGMPKEGYAFSNNAKAMLGPPEFDEAKFKLDKGKVQQTIKLNY